MAYPMMVWVDDTIIVLATAEDQSIQGVPVDQRSCFQGVLRISDLTRKSSAAPL